MKLARVYTGSDGESHIEQVGFDFSEREGTRTVTQKASAVAFAQRTAGSFSDFHTAPRRQYVLYLTVGVEIGLGDGSSLIMEPGDVLLAEDTTGHGHTSRVTQGGICAFVPVGE